MVMWRTLILGLLLLGCGPSDGPYIAHHDNGNVKEEGAYHGGKKTGTWTFYWKSGAKQVEGSYLKDKPHGVWRFYDEKGRLMAQGKYKNGKMWEGRFVRYIFGTKKIIVVKKGQQVN